MGGYKACSLFSPMQDFASQAAAVEVAGAVMAALFDGAARDGTDRAAEIRAAREAAVTAAQEAEPAAAEAPDELPTRRAVISVGLAGDGR